MDFKRILHAAATAVIAMSIGACSGGGSSSSSSSDSDRQQLPSNTDYRFTVNDDYTGTVDTIAQNIINYFIPPALAALSTQNIQVVKVNADGQIIQVLTPLEGPVDLGNGQYKLVLAEAESPNNVIVVNPEGPLNLQTGQTLNPAAYLFVPAVESDEVFEVSLTTTVTYKLFLDEVDSFENLSASEVDDILAAAEAKVEELGLTAGSREEMLTALISGLFQLVATETLLAAQTDDTLTVPDSTGSIEEDRAKIRGFFNDVNTLVALSSGLEDEDHRGLTEQLYGQVNSSQLVWQVSAATLEDFANMQSVISDAIAASDAGANISIASLFANDPDANLTGSIVETAESFQINVSGSYGVLSTVEFSGSAIATTSMNAVTFTLTGEIQSPDASIVLNDTELSLVTSSGINLSPDHDDYPAELADKLDTIDLKLQIELTAKGLIDGTDGVFVGTAELTAVRSNVDYVEYAGEEGIPHFNVANASLSGRFDLGDEFIEATVVAEQENARTFVPYTQDFTPGETYEDAFTYNYDSANTFTVSQPTGSVVFEASTYNYEVLTWASTQIDEGWGWAFSINDFLNTSSGLDIRYEHEYYSFSPEGLVEGTGTVLAQSGNNPVSTQLVTYTLTQDSFVYYIDRFDQSVELTLGAVSGDYVAIDRRIVNGNVPRNYGQNHHGEYYTSLQDYMATNEEWLYRQEHNYAYYTVKLSDLVFGTIDGTVVAQKQEWSSEDAPNTITVTYDYTADGFVLDKGLSTERKYEVLGINEYEALRVTGSYTGVDYFSGEVLETGVWIDWYSDDFANFETYLTERFFDYTTWWTVWFTEERTADFGLDFGEALVSGDNNPISAYVYWADSFNDYEDEAVFVDFKFDVTLSTQLAGLGATEIEASLDRTGFDDGILSFVLSNEHTNLNTEITVVAAAVDNEVTTFVVSNKDGLSVSNHDIQENEDGFEITFGLETAVVQEVDTGIKVTYSDGSFDLY